MTADDEDMALAARALARWQAGGPLVDPEQDLGARPRSNGRLAFDIVDPGRAGDATMTEPHPCTVEQITAFNRALHPLVLQACEQSGVPPTHVALYAEFVMSDGSILRGNLSAPLNAE